MKDLKERLERAEEGSRELDGAIWLAVVADADQREVVEVGREKFGDKEASFRISRMSDGMAYTTSLDAAKSLFPSGWWLKVFTKGSISRVFLILGGKQFDAEAATEELARCIAAPKARENHNATPDVP